MSLFESLRKFFTGSGNRPGGGSRQTFPLYVLDHRCREPIRGEVNLLSELSRTEENGEFFCHKVLHTSGEKRCFSQVDVQLWFNSKKQLIRQEVSGGKWLSAADFETEWAQFTAPPEEEDEEETISEDEVKNAGDAEAHGSKENPS